MPEFRTDRVITTGSNSDLFLHMLAVNGPVPDIGSDTNFPDARYVPVKLKLGIVASSMATFLSKSYLLEDRTSYYTIAHG
jgi:hypothetical protein